MRMRLHSAVLVTRRLDRLREFYTRTLGFKVTDDFGACIVLDCGLSLWQPADGHPVRACGGEDGREEDRGFPFELCFEADTVEEFESLAESLQRTGLPILHEVQTERWGQRTLRIQDPDGNLIEWGESIPCFVRRIYAASRNAADVASATGVALEKVQELVGLHPE
jgi:catechol 2,3-dioxygenase-like lactoylglutathione lyase family enzyme